MHGHHGGTPEGTALIDHIVPEPPGGAPSRPGGDDGQPEKVLGNELEKTQGLTPEKRLAQRRERLADYGAFKAGRSRKRRPLRAVGDRLHRWRSRRGRADRVRVGYPGGPSSCFCALSANALAAMTRRLAVKAHHVHHGLSPTRMTGGVIASGLFVAEGAALTVSRVQIDRNDPSRH